MNAAAPGVGAAPPPGSARHLAWLFAAAAQRDAIAALLSMESEIMASTRAGLDHGVAHARLAWWQEEAAEIAGGRPRHPLGRQLAQRFAGLSLSPPDLRGLVEVARLDLACSAFESQLELSEYLSQWTRGMFRNVALLLCPEPEARADVERFSSAAGVAVRDVELVARLASDARLGRVHAVLTPPPALAPAPAPSPAHEPWQAQPWNEAHARPLRERLHARRAALSRANLDLPVPRRAALRAAIAWCAVTARLADRCATALPLQYDSGRFEAFGSTWTAWRAALAATRGQVHGALQENR